MLMRLYMPWSNLGCLGFRFVGFGFGFYADIFMKPYFGVFYMYSDNDKSFSGRKRIL